MEGVVMLERITDGLKGFFINWVFGSIFWPTFWLVIGLAFLWYGPKKYLERQSRLTLSTIA